MSFLAVLLLQKGIALGLFHEDPDFSYAQLLGEMRATGADHVSVVVPWYQHNVRSTTIAAHPRFTPPDSTIARTIREAKEAGFSVMVFPILRLEVAGKDEWRGTIKPSNPEAWWQSYRHSILHLARLADRHGASLFCIGSELSTMDGDRPRWAALAREVKRVFHGTLLYSANWDRFRDVGLWDVVDQAGISAYFELAAGDRNPSVDKLIHAWKGFRDQILSASKKIRKPLVITEVGYLSQDGTADRPWDENAQEKIDLEEQRRCYEAFVRTWSGTKELAGVYFWNWYGWGGPQSREYTPRGKPAETELKRFFGGQAPPR